MAQQEELKEEEVAEFETVGKSGKSTKKAPEKEVTPETLFKKLEEINEARGKKVNEEKLRVSSH